MKTKSNADKTLGTEEREGSAQTPGSCQLPDWGSIINNLAHALATNENFYTKKF